MYLGRLLNLVDVRDAEIDHRLRGVWAKFAVFKQVFLDKDYSQHQGLRLFHSTITLTVLYGSCSWAMTADREQKLRSAQRKMLRAIFGRGRRVLERPDSSTNSAAGSGSLCSDGEEAEELESWVQWKQRVTEEVLEAIKKLHIAE